MGVLHGRDLFSSKYITAEIKDSSKRLHYVPIKHTIGDYFITKLDGQTYCFLLDNEVCQYREKATKSFLVAQYDTTHYRPIKSEIKELEIFCKKENIKKVNGTMSEVFKILGFKEKNMAPNTKPKILSEGVIDPNENNEFPGHQLSKLVSELEDYKTLDISKVLPKDEAQFTAKMKSMINYLKNMDIENIATPLRGISNFIEDDLKATDPKFMGTVGLTLASLDYENKKVTNVPIGSKQAWLKVMLVVMMVSMVSVLLVYGYEQGWFDGLTNITSGFGIQPVPIPGLGGPGAGSGPGSSQYYMNNYSPQELRAAIDAGEVDEDTLPKDIKEMVKDVKSPKVEPKGKEIVIGG